MPRSLLAVALAACAVLATACATTPARVDTSGRVRVVAAENFWGSIAAQLGGDKATVKSVIDKPGIDPHDYEPTAADARAFANAQLVVVNGVGYDPWAKRLLATEAVGHRHALDVGDVVGAEPGDNPHRWYDPGDVDAVIAAITSELQRIDPRDAAYFAGRRHDLESRGLADYHRLIADIKAAYAGTPVGASESIFALMAPTLGLRIETPSTFMAAISEGSEPAASDKAAVDRQIRTHAIKVYVFNAQNTNPDVRAEIAAARREKLPVVSLTETLTPATASFQQWQVGQLAQLAAALAKGTGR